MSEMGLCENACKIIVITDKQFAASILLIELEGSNVWVGRHEWDWAMAEMGPSRDTPAWPGRV